MGKGRRLLPHPPFPKQTVCIRHLHPFHPFQENLLRLLNLVTINYPTTLTHSSNLRRSRRHLGLLPRGAALVLILILIVQSLALPYRHSNIRPNPAQCSTPDLRQIFSPAQPDSFDEENLVPKLLHSRSLNLNHRLNVRFPSVSTSTTL